MTDVDHLIVGGGVAGLACAHELRSGSPDATIALVTREMDPPYDRTAVSKRCLVATVDRAELMLCPPSWYAEQRIDVRTRSAVLRLDCATKTAALADKTSVAFGTALVATGAMVRRLRVPGVGLRGVHHLRAPGNAEAVREDLDAIDGAAEVVLVGGSYVGCEVAAALTALGHSCTVVMLEQTCLETHLGADVGRMIEERLSARGIAFVGEDAVQELVGEDRVAGVRLRSGRMLGCDVCVVGVGAQPDVTLARSVGLPIGVTGGIRCSADLRVDGAQDIWAAGDACEWRSPGSGDPLRVEHWESAVAQGRVAARGMLSAPEDFDDPPRFWSDLSDGLVLRHAGRRPAGGGNVEVASMHGGFTARYADASGVTATLTVGIEEAPDPRRMIDPVLTT